jgi:hypothetical protein
MSAAGSALIYHGRYKLKNPIGQKRWAIAEGYIPEFSHGLQPEMTSHETACLLNTSDQEAHVQITIYFSDGESVGPYRVIVPANSAAMASTDEIAGLGLGDQQSHDAIGDSSSLEQVERRHIQSVLQRTDWVIEGERGAAKILDLHPNMLRSRIKKLGIERASVTPTLPATKSRSHEAITN